MTLSQKHFVSSQLAPRLHTHAREEDVLVPHAVRYINNYHCRILSLGNLVSDVRRQDYGWRFLLHRVTFGLLPFGGGGGAEAAVDYHHTRTNALPARRRKEGGAV